MVEAYRSKTRGHKFLVFLNRLLLCALVWWVLTDGELSWDALLVGVPAVVAAAGISAAMMPPLHWSWVGALKFAWFFARESLLGGVDVARRAFHPRMPLDPGVVRYEVGLAPDLARVAVSNTSSLLPGSLVVDIEGSNFHVHTLDVGRDAARSVELTEKRVAELLRVPLEQKPTASPQTESRR